jgi:hypothetical protein
MSGEQDITASAAATETAEEAAEFETEPYAEEAEEAGADEPPKAKNAGKKAFALSKGAEYQVIVLSDDRAYKIRNALTEYGEIGVVQYTTSVHELKSNIMYSNQPYILVIAETGTGRFTTGGLRADLDDVLGIASAADGYYIIVFHTPKFRAENRFKRGKSGEILFLPYSGTGNIVLTLKLLEKRFRAAFSPVSGFKYCSRHSLDNVTMDFSPAGIQFMKPYTSGGAGSLSDADFAGGRSGEDLIRLFREADKETAKSLFPYKKRR